MQKKTVNNFSLIKEILKCTSWLWNIKFFKNCTTLWLNQFQTETVKIWITMAVMTNYWSRDSDSSPYVFS